MTHDPMDDDPVELDPADEARVRELLHAAAEGVDVEPPEGLPTDFGAARRSTARPRWLAAVAAALVLVTVGGAWWALDDQREPTTAGPTGGSDDDRGTPGTPLGAGFTVVEGTRLLGVPVPLTGDWLRGGEPIPEQGWSATSLIEGGEPLDIIDAYLDQARAAELEAVQPPTCRQDVEVTICTAHARSSEDRGTRAVSISVVRGPRADVVSDHVVVQYTTSPDYWAMSGYWSHPDEEPEPTSGGRPPVPAPPHMPPVPGVGEPIGTANEVRTELRVLEGSRLAGPVRLNLDDASGGIVAMLEILGDPGEVFAGYREQLERERVDSFGPPTTVPLADATMSTAFHSAAGGDYFTLKLIEATAGGTWLAISGGHD